MTGFSLLRLVTNGNIRALEMSTYENIPGVDICRGRRAARQSKSEHGGMHAHRLHGVEMPRLVIPTPPLAADVPAKTDVVAGYRPPCVPMEPGDEISVAQAAYRARISEKTVRRWAAKFGIGRCAEKGAPLWISAPALEMRKHGDVYALELLRSGYRSDPAVLYWLNKVGVPVGCPHMSTHVQSHTPVLDALLALFDQGETSNENDDYR